MSNDKTEILRDPHGSSAPLALEHQPSLVERFEVQRVLGQGGGSIVYHVLDRERERQAVALKLLVNEGAFDNQGRARFREEWRVCSSISHPNLVRSFDMIEGDGVIALTMEYVQGEDLASLIRKGRPSIELVESIMDQLLGAIESLHANKILHRDIKLENVLLRSDGVVKLLDLGLIKNTAEERITKTGTLLGTAQYMPPEYIRTGVFTEQGDVYGAGCVLYELLTGFRRFADKAGAEAIQHLIESRFEISKATLAGVPARFVPIIERAMSAEPKRRFPSAEAFRTELKASRERALNGGEVGSVSIRGTLDNPQTLRRLAEQCSGGGYLRAGAAKSIFARGLAVALVSSLVVLTGIFGWREGPPQQSAPKSDPSIEVYRGEVLNYPQPNKATSIELKIVSGQPLQLLFRSSLKGCQSGAVNTKSGAIGCETQGYTLVLLERGVDSSGRQFAKCRFSGPGLTGLASVRLYR